MRELDLDHPVIEGGQKIPVIEQKSSAEVLKKEGKIAVLYSGGTDSTCVVAIEAEKYSQVHLLTYEERATFGSPIPLDNVRLLEKGYPDVRFIPVHMSVDRLVRYFWYEHYLHYVLRYGRLSLSTCGMSTLSWHVRTISYCLENDITAVADGLTRELMHFPGHMDGVVERFRALYAHFGIEYSNPVRSWPTPEDRQLIDQVLVNRHPYESLWNQTSRQKTTGWYLYERGVFPSPNMKGTRQDFSMQHECYPFALYNIMTFWGYLTFHGYDEFCGMMLSFMSEKIAGAQALLAAYRDDKTSSVLSHMLETTV